MGLLYFRNSYEQGIAIERADHNCFEVSDV